MFLAVFIFLSSFVFVSDSFFLRFFFGDFWKCGKFLENYGILAFFDDFKRFWTLLQFSASFGGFFVLRHRV